MLFGVLSLQVSSSLSSSCLHVLACHRWRRLCTRLASQLNESGFCLISLATITDPKITNQRADDAAASERIILDEFHCHFQVGGIWYLFECHSFRFRHSRHNPVRMYHSELDFVFELSVLVLSCETFPVLFDPVVMFCLFQSQLLDSPLLLAISTFCHWHSEQAQI